MTISKVAITLETDLLYEIDSLVKNRIFPNRSRAIQDAVRNQLEKTRKKRLLTEITKLSKKEEQELAEEGFDISWQEK